MPEQNGVSSANTENQNRPEPDADANSPEDALAWLEAMCLMANLGLGLSEIRGLIAAAFQLITYQSRLPDGKRRLIQIGAQRPGAQPLCAATAHALYPRYG